MTRQHDGYEPRFDLDLEVGQQGELWVANIADALRTHRVEVKNDRGAILRTHNLYIEYLCWRGGKWQPSGIATTQADVWVYAIDRAGLGLIVETELLKNTARRLGRGRDSKYRRQETDGSHPTCGIVVPINELLREAQTRRLPKAA